MTAATDPPNVLTFEFQPTITQELEIRDLTLRDGEQTPNVAFTRDEKIELAEALDDLGVDLISAGFPAVSEYEAETARMIASRVKCTTACMARLVRSDVDAVARAGVDRVGLFISSSDWHLFDKLKITEDDVIKKLEDVIPYAVSLGLDIILGVEDATRTPLPRLKRFVQAAQEFGANDIDIADTLGVLVPSATYKIVEIFRPLIKGRFSVHFHNDLGLATANSLAALEAGANGVDVSVAGLGERTGNTPLEELAVILNVKYGITGRIDLKKLPAVTALAARFARTPVPTNKPVVGENVFSHESGIHVHGLLSNPITYQPFPPALVGREHRIIYGKHSGLAGLRYLLKREAIELSHDAENAVLQRIKDTGQRKERVSEEMVLAWVREAAQQSAVAVDA